MIFFTTLKGGSVCFMEPGEMPREWIQMTCPNGQTIHPDGRHFICDSMERSIVAIHPATLIKTTIINRIICNEEIHCPNDLIFDKEGNLYFTDSIRYKGKVCSIAANGEEKVLARGLDYPNGLAISKDGKRLWIAESYKNQIIELCLDISDSNTGFPDVFCRLPFHPNQKTGLNLPDGIRIDRQGNLLVAHYGMNSIVKIGSNGELIESIPVPLSLPSNLCLAENQLIVTGGLGEPGPGRLVIMDYEQKKN